jgi:inorganic pyrophosphatase
MKSMQVFVEQPGERNKKNVFDKKTGEFLRTVSTKLTYPYPYGYILNTRADDGDNLDCYIVTNQKLDTGGIVECEAVGMVEWFEDGEEDHKILTVLKGEYADITGEVKSNILYFAEHFFDDQPEKKYKIGKFCGKEEAMGLIRKSSVAHAT